MKNNNSSKNLSEPVYTLGVAAKLSNTSVYSLRQYVDKGLVIPYRTKTNRYLYSEGDIIRLKCIRRYLDELGLNIAGIRAIFALVPCWLLKPCSEQDRQGCDGYTAIDRPCWEVNKKGGACKNEDCRTCKVYLLPEKCKDLKTLFKKLNKQEI
jgi:MerR family transcriptional regulator/heat shock protein HspR